MCLLCRHAEREWSEQGLLLPLIYRALLTSSQLLNLNGSKYNGKTLEIRRADDERRGGIPPFLSISLLRLCFLPFLAPSAQSLTPISLTPTQGKPAETFGVFIRNLPLETDEEQLRAIFKGCGAIIAIRLPTHKDSGKRKGSAPTSLLGQV